MQVSSLLNTNLFIEIIDTESPVNATFIPDKSHGEKRVVQVVLGLNY